MYGNKDSEGIPATYQILYFIGWKPDESQVRVLFVIDNVLVNVNIL